VSAVVVIPAYNEAATVRGVVERALRACDHVIVVDDGSEDGTAGALAGLPVTLIRHARNLGKAASLWDGMQAALARDGVLIVTLDADGQHEPADIPRLLVAAAQHPGQIVIGARLAQAERFPARRLLGNRIARFWISWACGYRVADSQSGFRVYPAALLREVPLAHDRAHGFVFESEILIEAARRGVQSVAVPINAIYPPNRRASYYRAVVDTWRIVRMVAWKLLQRGLYLPGFWRAFVRPR
jgi:glycosyltransferase involved in cell wall biosynthesis